jgi:hypothetical protein
MWLGGYVFHITSPYVGRSKRRGAEREALRVGGSPCRPRAKHAHFPPPLAGEVLAKRAEGGL